MLERSRICEVPSTIVVSLTSGFGNEGLIDAIWRFHAVVDGG
jgi:hypothetical protein